MKAWNMDRVMFVILLEFVCQEENVWWRENRGKNSDFI